MVLELRESGEKDNIQLEYELRTEQTYNMGLRYESETDKKKDVGRRQK
jgi:hypothetical protein